MDERGKLLSSAVDVLTSLIELEDDARLRQALALVLRVVVDENPELEQQLDAQ